MDNLWHWWEHVTGLDNLSGPYYGFWSGFEGVVTQGAILIALYHIIVHFNCHEPTCRRIGKYIDHESGTRWCGPHMPQKLIDAHPKPHHLAKFGHRQTPKREQSA